MISRQKAILSSVLGLILTSLIGCSSSAENSGALKGWREAAVGGKEPLQVTLPNLVKNGGGHIRFAAVKENLDTHGAPERTTNVKIWFGKLSAADCEILKGTYADSWESGLSGVDCQQAQNQRNFFLQDFLSPAMQANIRHVFDEEVDLIERPLTPAEQRQFEIDGGGSVKKSVLDTNCWSTAYETLRRSRSEFAVHWFSSTELLSAMQARGTSRTGSITDVSGLNIFLDNFGAEFGNLLVVKDLVPGENDAKTFEIVHMAIFVDRGLLFERVGNGLPARLILLSDVTAQYPDARYEVFRIKDKLPHVNELSQLTKVRGPYAEEGLVYEESSRVKTYPLNQDAAGRFQISQ